MRLRAAVALAFCAGAAAPFSLPAAVCAAEGARAALVVDTGDVVTTYCVALPDASVSGIELVELAGEQHGLDYSLGYGGEAVCRLEGVGPDGGDCFAEYPEFWGYWHGSSSGGWSWAGSGAASATIEDGDVEGWSWGDGDNGTNHQAPPPTQFSDVCAAVAPSAAPDEKQGRSRPRGGGPDPAPSGAPEVAAPDPVVASSEGQERVRRPRHPRKKLPALPSASPAPSPTPGAREVAAQPAGDETGGPPLTGVVGLLAAGAIGAAAWATSRRRSRG